MPGCDTETQTQANGKIWTLDFVKFVVLSSISECNIEIHYVEDFVNFFFLSEIRILDELSWMTLSSFICISNEYDDFFGLTGDNIVSIFQHFHNANVR